MLPMLMNMQTCQAPLAIEFAWYVLIQENDEWIRGTQLQRQESMEDQGESPPSSPTVNLVDDRFADCDSSPPQLTDLTSSNLVDHGS